MPKNCGYLVGDVVERAILHWDTSLLPGRLRLSYLKLNELDTKTVMCALSLRETKDFLLVLFLETRSVRRKPLPRFLITLRVELSVTILNSAIKVSECFTPFAQCKDNNACESRGTYVTVHICVMHMRTVHAFICPYCRRIGSVRTWPFRLYAVTFVLHTYLVCTNPVATALRLQPREKEFIVCIP